jgi:hypothetical protein
MPAGGGFSSQKLGAAQGLLTSVEECEWQWPVARVVAKKRAQQEQQQQRAGVAGGGRMQVAGKGRE